MIQENIPFYCFFPYLEFNYYNHWSLVCVCYIASVISDSLNPVDCNPPGSSVHGILQARILKWVVMPSSRGSSQPKDQTCFSYVSWISRWVLYHESHLGSPYGIMHHFIRGSVIFGNIRNNFVKWYIYIYMYIYIYIHTYIHIHCIARLVRS